MSAFSQINGRLGILLLLFAFTSCERLRPQPDQTGDAPQTAIPSPTPFLPPSVHLAFGNPSNATQDTDNDENYLVVGDGSAFSYNNERGTVNWISWKTTRADLGDSIRRPDFRPDPRLPSGFDRIGYYDYSGSGYDRGHMVPSADRFANAKLNEETFMMTNIVPQTGALNQFPWERFESFARSQVYRGFDAYQIAGVYGEQRVLKRKVVVPTNCWKIIALLPRGRSADRIDERTRIIAVDMPNIKGIENDAWEKYKTTIREIETKTGYDFFSTMPRKLQDEIETRKETVNP
ncbi:MAG TPA: DNA/RNA non-specific endonuclease [Pyrinomonadaceae bacterium]|nr:DNA/RNA non-specific endonuclease [Pyrinomonadaceae bacterium]